MIQLSKKQKTVVVTLIAIVVAFVIYERKGDERSGKAPLTYSVRRGQLVISINEPGTIEAQNKIAIKSKIVGSTTVLSLIDEGAKVKKGDLLAELDAGKLKDTLFEQQLKVQSTEALYKQAKEQLDITRSISQSDIEKAQTDLDFAKQDYDKYVKGEYPQQVREAEASITLAKEELQRSREKLKWSQILYKQKLISQTELQADELAAKKNSINLDLEINKKKVLEEYTNKRQIAKFESDIKQAEMALDRVTHQSKSDVLKAEIDLAAKESEYKRQQDRLATIKEQLAATKIYAPSDGQVLYATSSGKSRWKRGEPLSTGSTVYEKEVLFYLPDTSKMMASIKVHESSVKKIKVGMEARVTVDALPGTEFKGHIHQIAPLPDAVSFWMNPDLKVYDTEVYIDQVSGSLRSGMSCEVEVIAAVYTNVIYVPVQSVVKTELGSTVYVVDDANRTEKRAVKTGDDNGVMIRIINGLREGESVMLAPPLSGSQKPTAARPGGSMKSAGKRQAGHVEVEQRDKVDGESP